jgi:hypothetical protein
MTIGELQRDEKRSFSRCWGMKDDGGGKPGNYFNFGKLIT